MLEFLYNFSAKNRLNGRTVVFAPRRMGPTPACPPGNARTEKLTRPVFTPAGRGEGTRSALPYDSVFRVRFAVTPCVQSEQCVKRDRRYSFSCTQRPRCISRRRLCPSEVRSSKTNGSDRAARATFPKLRLPNLLPNVALKMFPSASFSKLPPRFAAASPVKISAAESMWMEVGSLALGASTAISPVDAS